MLCTQLVKRSYHMSNNNGSRRAKSFRYWIKRWTTRKMRRAAKHNPENAPRVNRYYGWDN